MMNDSSPSTYTPYANVDIDDDNDSWQRRWLAISHDGVETEMKLCREVQETLTKLWSEESKKYEETMETKISGSWTIHNKTVTVPRRNYFNPQGIVKDSALFPYHTSLYPLLDAYDSLNSNVKDLILLTGNAVRPFPPTLPSNRLSFHDIDAEESPLFLCCSDNAISLCLGCSLDFDENFTQDMLDGRSKFWFMIDNNLACHRSFIPVIDSDGDMAGSTLSSIRSGASWFCRVVPTIIETTHNAIDGPFGPRNLPKDRHERTEILLRLIQHSLSEQQRDYRLAGAVLLLIIRLRDLDDVDVFRKLLTVIDMEFQVCGGPCDDTDGTVIEHDCSDWFEFYSQLCSHVFSDGLTTFTHEHGLCLSVFVRNTFLRQFRSLVPELNKNSVADKSKSLLVRAVVSRQADDDEAFSSCRECRGDIAGRIPVEFIATMIRSLGSRGIIERNLQSKLLDDIDNPRKVDTFRQSVNSYHNTVWTLVSIANSTVQLLPESERFYGIASLLVQSLCRCLCKKEYSNAWDQGAHQYTAMVWGQFDVPSSLRLISPLRYANCITTSTAVMLEQRAHRNTLRLEAEVMGPIHSIHQEFLVFFEQQPRLNVLEAVRGLFLRNLVDVRISCLGYGDFLVWCQYDISPLDPVLFWSEYAYPDEEGSDDDDDDEEESLDEADRPANWGLDEVGHTLTYSELSARHDFTLLLLQRAWQSPWTPETHASFQPPFRDAVEAVAKSTHKLGFPHETMVNICSFLHREWWEDSRKQCWCYSCIADKSTQAITLKMLPDHSILSLDNHLPNTSNLEYCSQCHVATYCSKNCRNRDHYLGHKGRCSRPPMVATIPDKDEARLYLEVLADDGNLASLPQFLMSRCSISTDPNIEEFADDDACINSDADDSNDGNDDGSWETVDSADEATDSATTSKTQKIWNYFNDKRV